MREDDRKTKEQLEFELDKLRKKVSKSEKTASDTQYKTLFDLSPDGVVVLDTRGFVTSCNSAYYELTGFTEDEIIGKHFTKLPLLKTKDIPKYTKVFASILGRQAKTPLEFTWIHKNGSSRVGEARWGLIKSGRRITGVQVVLRDITERKGVEKALLESEERYRMLFESSSIGMGLADSNGKTLNANSTMARIFRCSIDELVGIKITDYYVNPDDRQPLIQALNRDGEISDRTVHLKRKDGTQFYASISIRPIVLQGKSVIQTSLIDITERTVIEKELQTSENLYRTLFEGSENPIAVYDRDANIVMINDLAAKNLGKPQDDIIGSSLGDFMPESFDVFVERFRKVLKTKKPIYVEDEVTLSDGKHWFLSTIHPIIDEEQKSELVQVVSYEDTERKRAEDELRKQEEQYRLVVENANQGLAVVQDRVIRFCNPKLLEILGYSFKELSSKPFGEFIHPDDREMAASQHVRRLEGKEISTYVQYRMIRKNGEIRWIETNAVIIEWEGKLATLGFITDITEQKQVEDAKNVYLSGIENAVEGIAYSDMDGNIVRFNKASCEIFGYTPAEMERINISKLSATSTDEKILEESVKRNGYFQGEISGIRKNGEEFPAILSVSIIKDEKGKPVGRLGVFSDITEQRQAEETLTESLETRRELVDASTDIIELIDTEGSLLVINEEGAKSFGREQDGLIGLNIWDLLPTELAEARKEQAESVVQTGQLIRFEDQNEGRWFGNVYSPIFDEKGKVTRIAIVSRDVTGRMIARRRLEESEEQYRTLFEGTSNPILIIDSEGNYVDCNKAALQFFECTLDEILRKNVRDTMPPEVDSTKVLKEHLPLWESSGTIETKYNVNGSVKSLLLTITPGLWQGKHMIFGVGTDISEQKQIEEALKESEKNFRNSMDNSPLGIIILGDRLAPPNEERVEILYANKAILDLYGFKNIEEMRITPLTERYTPETAAEVKERVKQRELGIPRPSNYIAEILNRNGEIRSLEAFTREVMWDGISRNQIIYNDVTERERVERELILSQQSIRATLDRSYSGIVIFDDDNKSPDGWAHILYANKTLLDMYGYSSFEELRATPQAENYTPQSLIEAKERIKSGVKKQWVQAPYQMEIITRQGEYRTFEAATNNIIWEGKQRRQLIINDITEQKKTEEALKESEQNLRNSMDNSPLGIIILGERVDPPHQERAELLYANKAILDIYGLSSVEELRNLRLDERVTPDTVIEIEERIRQRELGIPMPTYFTVDIINRNGEIRNVEVFTREVWWDGLPRVQMLYTDITERKKLEEEREEIQKRAQIAGRLSSVGEMAAGIAHEINNPLTGVVGFADLLANRDLPEDIRREIEIISEGGHRVASIVRRMLSFARQTKPKREIVDINEIITTTLEMRASAMNIANIDIITELDGELPETIADGGQLQQVFLNIILNAEAEMSKAHDKGNLTVKTDRINGVIRISITDDGPGITKENLEKIFNPFFTTREVGEGTGLGLSICHGIITEHGGTIHAESKRGKGATFIIDLPIVTEDKQLELGKSEGEELTTTMPSKILIVDDETIVQRYLTDVLTGEGHDVKIIENGGEAFQEINNNSYDVILLDIKLPGKTGIEIYREIRKKSKSVVKKIIFITGDVMGQDTMAFLSRNNVPYITKPLDTEQLNEKINYVMAAK